MDKFNFGDWTNFGDVSPYHGQLWIKDARVDNDSDFAECVEIINASEFGGADNVYMITRGSIYIPDDKTKRKSALDCIDKTPSLATWIDLALAFHAYHGVEPDTWGGITNVQIGKAKEARNTISIDVVLHGNASIRRYIEKEFLQ